MTDAGRWFTSIGIGLVTLGLAACSSSSGSERRGAAGSGAAAGGSSEVGGDAGQGASGAAGTVAGSGAAGELAGSGGAGAVAGSGAAGQLTGSGGAGAVAASGAAGAVAGSGAAGASAGAGPGGGSGGALVQSGEARSELPHDTTPDVSDADYQAFISSTNEFGLDLFEQFIADDTNVVFSPVSTAVALGMTYAGARNNTATQMAAVMHNGLSDDAFHAAQNQLALDLDSRNVAPHETEGGEKSVRLSLVNAAWAQDGYEILQPFLDTLATNYDSGVKLLDFIADPNGSRELINEWVADQTEDKIEDLIGPGAITPNTRVVLTNALYFYATWDQPFAVDATSDGTFYTLAGGEVTAAMMHQTSSLPYAEGDGYQLVDLPYDGGELAMTILLPEAGRFVEIRDSLSSDWLAQAHASISIGTEVELSLPKFSFTWGTESLKEPLKALGMTDAFDELAADFTGIEPRRELYVSDVLHQAFIGVDEDGTEAAAATAVILSFRGTPESPVPFTVDRPFIFFIRDTTGLLLFAGQVLDPSAEI
jgi:serpin B